MTETFELIPQGTVTSPEGFFAGAAYGGLNEHAKFKLDVGILLSQTPCTAAGVFTQNQLKSAPVILCQERLPASAIRAVIANSGCANASTGAGGMEDALIMAKAAAAQAGIAATEVLVASTGIIGRRLPIELLCKAVSEIELSAPNGHLMAKAIMTTDTTPKEVACRAGGFTIGAIAKGAGMIHPNMGTMLCFITTDASASADFLSQALKTAADKSFNMVSVDGDTSPNDTVLLLANGQSRQEITTEKAPLFQEALDAVCIYLAKAIARDGEGATKLIEITVRGAETLAAARDAARTIASSSLVKTAIHGADPNWGRIIAAAGRSKAKVEEGKINLTICGLLTIHNGAPTDFDCRHLSSLLRQNEVIIELDLGLGSAEATAWGCDLSADYVSINADYTT